VSLKHHLGMASIGVPELHATVFRAAHDPLAAWSQADAEHVVLVPFECPYALATIGCSRRKDASLRSQFPHLDRLVQTSTDQLAACRRECHRVDTVPVSVGSLETLD